MKNRWDDDVAQSYCERYAAQGEDLALRVYTSHLIGADRELVMHGGGNTSVKSTWTNLLGESVPALFIKGSGWNLDAIEPQGFPGLDLNYLVKLRSLQTLNDEEMVNQLRTHMFDSTAPNPSVETLLHAFLPKKFVDHSHADAILSLTNQPNGWELVQDKFGDRLALIPYVMPGFALSKLAAEAFEKQPDCDGLLLYRHGLFTFADDAKTSYDLHIQFVTEAEGVLEKQLQGKTIWVSGYESSASAADNAAMIAPWIRGCLAERDDDGMWNRFVLQYRCSDDILAFANASNVAELCHTGPITPDHIIRTKQYAACISDPDFSNPEALKLQVQAVVDSFGNDYHDYFQKQCSDKKRQLTELDPYPRVIVVPGAGLFTVGLTLKAAAIAGDIYETTLHIKGRVQAAAGYESLDDDDLFDVEYWSLEQAKLGKSKKQSLTGQVAVITGAGGAIGRGIALQLARAGAHLALLDIDIEAATAAAEEVNQQCPGVALALACDVTDRSSVNNAFDQVALHFGGWDILVPNAGIAYSAPIQDMDPEKLANVMDVNFTGYFHVIQEGSRRLIQQGTGGHIVINSSKNVFAPGKEFSAYSASKAAGHQLGKIAALELAEHDIRVNMINADAVFSHGDVASGLWQTVAPGRAKAKGIQLDELYQYYMDKNLLKTAVLAEHVGNAVVFFASNQTPTTGATLPVDGGIPEAFPR